MCYVIMLANALSHSHQFPDVIAAPVVRTGGRRQKKLGDRDGRGCARGMGTETLLKEHKKRVAHLC